MIHVDPARNLVVVFLSAWPEATSRARSDERQTFLRELKAAL
jgi:CubicO group peptidase (beta-lactamase class C family)